MIAARLVAMAGAVIFTTPGTAADTMTHRLTPATSERINLADPLPRPRIEYPGGVTAITDVQFAVPRGFRPLTLDVYFPPLAKSGPGAPIVVYIHGGGWIAGHTRHAAAFTDWPAVLASVAAQGFVVASVEFRLSGEAPFPAAMRDVRTAIGWLRANATTLGADPNRVVAWGGSSGSQLSLLAAVACDEEQFAPVLDPAPPQAGFVPATAESSAGCVQGAIGWHGIYDFAALLAPARAPDRAPAANATGSPAATRPAGNSLTLYLGCEAPPCDPAIVALASPITRVSAGAPPMLLLHGTDDKLVPVAQSRDFFRVAKAAGIDIEYIEMPDIGHGFVGADPAATREANLRVLNTTLAFFERVTALRP